MKTRKIRLWGGTLVIKHRERLNYPERCGKVPIYALGARRFIWWSDEAAVKLEPMLHVPRMDDGSA